VTTRDEKAPALSTSSTPTFDIAEFKRALEKRDVACQLALHAHGAEVRVSELPLDHHERDTVVRHLDRMGVSRLCGANQRLQPAAAAA